MKVILPSKGVLGTRSVDLRQVTFNDLRAMHSMSDDPRLLQIELVKSLLPKDTDYTKITYYDFEYLFNTTVFSVLSNVVNFQAICPSCGSQHEFEFDISQCEVKTLDGFKKPITKAINNKDYTFSLLSAAQHFEAVDYAITREDEKYGYDDACVCFILNGSLDDIDSIPLLPANVYMAGLLFHRVSFHGVALLSALECPKCHSKFPNKLTITPDIIRLELSKLMDVYANINTFLTFEDFSNMTIPEYTSFISALNNQAENG